MCCNATSRLLPTKGTKTTCYVKVSNGQFKWARLKIKFKKIFVCILIPIYTLQSHTIWAENRKTYSRITEFTKSIYTCGPTIPRSKLRSLDLKLLKRAVIKEIEKRGKEKL